MPLTVTSFKHVVWLTSWPACTISLWETSMLQQTYSYCCAFGDCRSLQRSQPDGANTPAPCLLPPGCWPSLRPGCHLPVPVTSPLSHTHTHKQTSMCRSVSELRWLTVLLLSSALMNPTRHFCFQPGIGACC